MAEGKDGIWLEVSRARIEGSRVEVQVVGDKHDESPRWWEVLNGALAEKARQPTFHAIARGLDNSEQTVIAKLGPNEKLLLACKSLRIQTK